MREKEKSAAKTRKSENTFCAGKRKGPKREKEQFKKGSRNPRQRNRLYTGHRGAGGKRKGGTRANSIKGDKKYTLGNKKRLCTI